MAIPHLKHIWIKRNVKTNLNFHKTLHILQIYQTTSYSLNSELHIPMYKGGKNPTTTKPKKTQKRLLLSIPPRGQNLMTSHRTCQSSVQLLGLMEAFAISICKKVDTWFSKPDDKVRPVSRASDNLKNNFTHHQFYIIPYS